MVAFASNSILCRAALADGSIDAVSFSGIRLAAGAAALLLLSRGRGAGGGWISAAALSAYAFAFSIAYLRLAAGAGALILFGTVQATMIAAGMRRGERPGAREWIGLALALVGLVALTRPGIAAPDPLGALLMSVAGLAWGVYSLRGRGTADPVAANAGNFARSVAFALLALAIAPAVSGGLQVSGRGAGLAVASGAVTSGLGYALWYAALRGLTGMRAAIVQLSVAPLAALGGVAFLGERLTIRLAACGAVILGGIALAVTRRKPATSRA
jgi:drug/metabolite transporter (DMT)-like permease